jgi:hypothetical protein
MIPFWLMSRREPALAAALTVIQYGVPPRAGRHALIG